METKAFRIVTSISVFIACLAALLSLAGIFFTGFYPAIPVFLCIATIPLASRMYAKKIGHKSANFRNRYFGSLTVLNSIVVLVVLWMAFVIIHDRVLGDV